MDKNKGINVKDYPELAKENEFGVIINGKSQFKVIKGYQNNEGLILSTSSRYNSPQVLVKSETVMTLETESDNGFVWFILPDNTRVYANSGTIYNMIYNEVLTRIS